MRLSRTQGLAPQLTPTSSQGRGGSSSRARVEAPDPEKKSKSNVEEQLSKCKYKRMISRYFLCLTEMRLRFAKIVLLRAPQGL